ncbi:MAG: aminodeoxychorismate synthase component I [Zymomonas mobilis]|uniref:aminodeoxychorismate synthase n=1 Tax=Zymomonas mobilis TaxID=542 RepID=A0A542VZC6_ZYMMB|nr:aminodeoxychorismate synthase component I [Zymomonas mobilis]TQL16653.1 aminodeoxychorismate synthase subunit I [Zymomonas mobilis]
MWLQKIDLKDPLVAADILSSRPGFAFLDSAMHQEKLGRYSYVAADPFAQLTVYGNQAYWNGLPEKGDPLDVLQRYLMQFAFDETVERHFPFQGGCIGYVGYDYGRCLEVIKDYPEKQDKEPDISFCFYDVVLAFDHVTGESYLFSSGFPEKKPEKRAVRAKKRLNQFYDWLFSPSNKTPVVEKPVIPSLKWQSNFTKERYCQAIETVKNYIRQGDIYQANIAQSFSTEIPDDFQAWPFYRQLRHINPATFGAYLSWGDEVIASASPERFVLLQDNHVETRPIKGTSRRSSDPEEDRLAAEELLHSDKDRAENIMIVDLLRNDLSRVCTADSVDVTGLCRLESYAGVHHLVSVVTGELRPENSASDLLRACFPGGSITGAPKIRAMEIIAEIEKLARGVYCGSIGYIDFGGNLDFNIAIRTVTLSHNKAVFQVGGGITLLSDPEAEYTETLTKAAKIFESFGTSVSEIA